MIQSFLNCSPASMLQKSIRDVFDDNKILMSSLPYYSTSVLFVLAYLLITEHSWALFCILNVGVPLLD